jgi:hypothetical protein
MTGVEVKRSGIHGILMMQHMSFPELAQTLPLTILADMLAYMSMSPSGV